MKDIRTELKKRIIILDGAVGTELQKSGLPQGECPERWCLKNPRVIESLHLRYHHAKADIIYTSTFGANRIKLAQYGIKNVGTVNKKLALLAKGTVGNRAWVAGSVGPTGRFIEPFGSLKFEEAVEIFKEQARGLLDGGIDIFVIETMMDIQEARAALIAIKEISDKFTAVTMTYEKDGRTLNGTDPIAALITLQSLGADAVGCNCSTGPEDMLDFIRIMKPYAVVPLIAKPNAGMPKLIKGRTFFDMKAKRFASFGKRFVSKGVNLLGGCCGTTPNHIKELKKEVNRVQVIHPLKKSISALSSLRECLVIEPDKPLIIVGECINPTGKKDLQQELSQGKTSLIGRLAREQEAGGAKLLDVNVGLAGIGEVKTIRDAVNFLSVNSRLPLVIDSSKVEAIEAALRLYPGRALINSISGEKKKLKKHLSMAKKYGAMFILLPLDEKGIPQTSGERKEIVKYVLRQSQKAGFTKDDIVLDGMVMAISSKPGSVLETLDMITWASKVLKINTIIGLSNVSFGLPNRPLLNSAYLAIAEGYGLTMAIANPLDKELVNTKRAADVLMSRDKDGALFIQASSAFKESNLKDISPKQKVFRAIIEGNKDDIKNFVKQALKSGCPANKLVNQTMIPAINKTGDLFEKKKYFLPQLIAGAETMRIAFNYLEPYLQKGRIKQNKRTVVLLAAVKGDIHDIGKNIVALLLKNHGFSVIDLGKDVSAEKIIREIKRHKSPVVGLSALMTTTMVNMKEVIDRAKKERLDCRFIVGGAVVTKSYADSIDAEYAKDGVDAARLIKNRNIKRDK